MQHPYLLDFRRHTHEQQRLQFRVERHLTPAGSDSCQTEESPRCYLSLSPCAGLTHPHFHTHCESQGSGPEQQQGEKTRTKLHHSTVGVSAFHGNKKLRWRRSLSFWKKSEISYRHCAVNTNAIKPVKVLTKMFYFLQSMTLTSQKYQSNLV